MATKVTTGLLSDNSVTDAKLSATITATTQSDSDNTTKVATTAFVSTAIANLADSAPSTLNTLNELAAALGDDANYATTTTNAIAAKAPLASPTFTGTVEIPNLTISSAQGSDGQVLTSTGSGIAWEAIPAAGVAGIVTSADATAITIDSSERVMIGSLTSAVSANAQKLQIANAGATSVYQSSLVLQSQQNDGNANVTRIGFYGGDGSSAARGFSSIEGGKENSTSGEYGGMISMSTRPHGGTSTERMRINESGDVLIGQTSQTGYAFAQKLVVGDGDANDGITIQSGSTHQGNLAFNHSDGTTAHGRISYQHGTNYMQFFVNNSEKMRIVNNTASGAGGTSGNGVAFSNAGIAFDRSWANFPGIGVCNTSGTSQTNQSEFRIHGNNNTYNSYPSASGSDFSINLRIDGSTYVSSDRRKKTEITSLTSAIDTVKQLDGKRFKIISSEGKTQDHLSKSGYTWGFIAQDIEDVVPDIVKHYEDEDDGTEEYNNAYAVNYAAMVALLTNAIKEQQTLIESLTAKIDNAGL